jgi:hypothetical protein
VYVVNASNRRLPFTDAHLSGVGPSHIGSLLCGVTQPKA